MSRDAEDIPLFERMAASEDSWIESGALKGWLGVYELEDFEYIIDRLVYSKTESQLTHSQHCYHATSLLFDEVSNGGLAQYFFNSYSDSWKYALEGLANVEQDEEAVDAFKKAIALFGENGPSTDREERQNQLSKIYDDNEEVFSEYDSKLYGPIDENRWMRHILANVQDFQARNDPKHEERKATIERNRKLIPRLQRQSPQP